MGWLIQGVVRRPMMLLKTFRQRHAFLMPGHFASRSLLNLLGKEFLAWHAFAHRNSLPSLQEKVHGSTLPEVDPQQFRDLGIVIDQHSKGDERASHVQARVFLRS